MIGTNPGSCRAPLYHPVPLRHLTWERMDEEQALLPIDRFIERFDASQEPSSFGEGNLGLDNPNDIAIATARMTLEQKLAHRQDMLDLIRAQSSSSMQVRVAAVRFLSTLPDSCDPLTKLVTKDTPLLLVLAIVSLMSSIAAADPKSIPLVVPALLSWYEQESAASTAISGGSTASAAVEDIRTRSISFAAKVQLGALLNNADAERYHALIGESLQTRKRKALDSDDELETGIDAASSKRQKTSAAFWGEQDASSSVIRLPLQYVCECVLASIAQQDIERIRRAVQAGLWTAPPMAASIAAEAPAHSQPASVVSAVKPQRAKEQPGAGITPIVSCVRRIVGSKPMLAGKQQRGATGRKWQTLLASLVSTIGTGEVLEEVLRWTVKTRSPSMAVELLRSHWLAGQLHDDSTADHQSTTTPIMLSYEQLLDTLLQTFREDTEQMLHLCIAAPSMPFSVLREHAPLPVLEKVVLARPSSRMSIVAFLVEHLEREGVLDCLLRIYVAVREVRRTIEDAATAAGRTPSSEKKGSVELLIRLVAVQPRLLPRLLTPDLDEPVLLTTIRSLLPSAMASAATDRRIARLAAVLAPCIRNAPPHLVTDILIPLVSAVIKTHPTDALQRSIKQCILDDAGLDIHLLLPVLGVVDREDVDALLPRILVLLPDTPTAGGEAEGEDGFVRSVLFRLVETGRIDAVGLFVRLHMLEPVVGTRRTIAALQLCFSSVSVFGPEVLAAALQAMLEHQPMPSLFMRSVLQSATLHVSLRGFIVGLLARLVASSKNDMRDALWTEARTWEGFVRACRLLLPASLPVLTQLPSDKLADFFRRSGRDSVQVVREHLWEQPPSVRKRFAAIVDVIEQMFSGK